MNLCDRSSHWWAPYSTGPPRSTGTGDSRDAPVSAAEEERSVAGQTGTSDILSSAPREGREMGPSFWLPQMSESLVTELPSSVAEVRLPWQPPSSSGSSWQRPSSARALATGVRTSFWHEEASYNLGDSFQK